MYDFWLTRFLMNVGKVTLAILTVVGELAWLFRVELSLCMFLFMLAGVMFAPRVFAVNPMPTPTALPTPEGYVPDTPTPQSTAFPTPQPTDTPAPAYITQPAIDFVSPTHEGPYWENTPFAIVFQVSPALPVWVDYTITMTYWPGPGLDWSNFDGPFGKCLASNPCIVRPSDPTKQYKLAQAGLYGITVAICYESRCWGRRWLQFEVKSRSRNN